MIKWTEVIGLFFEGELLQKYAKDKTALEVGSYMGKSSVCIAEVAKSLVCVDTFKGIEGEKQSQVDQETTYQYFINNTKDYQNKITTYKMTSDEYFSKCTDLFDLIFLDGWHQYDQTKKDIKNSLNHLNQDGIIACHDYFHPLWPGVKQAVDELLEVIAADTRITSGLVICRPKK